MARIVDKREERLPGPRDGQHTELSCSVWGMYTLLHTHLRKSAGSTQAELILALRVSNYTSNQYPTGRQIHVPQNAHIGATTAAFSKV